MTAEWAMRDGTLSVVAVIAVGVSLVTAATLWTWISQQRDWAYQVQAKSIAYADAQREFENRCSGLAAEETFACLRERLAQAREPARAEEALAAQQETARWTLLAALITGLIGVGTITVAGLAAYWVRQTLQAANAANQIMYADQRPWISLEREVACDFLLQENDSATLQWRYKVSNIGRLPAHRLVLHQTTVRHRGWHDVAQQKEAFVAKCRNLAHSHNGQVLLPDDAIKGDRPATCSTAFFAEGEHYALIVCLTYLHQQGTQIGLDAQVFEIEPDSRFPTSPSPYPLRICAISAG